MDVFSVKSLSIDVFNKNILHDITFSAKTRDFIAIIGPNGAGKSTLLKGIMNHYTTKIKSGNIFFNKKSLKNLDTYKIARSGIYYIDQNPIELEGVKLIEIIREILKIKNKKKSFLDQIKTINKAFEDFELNNSLLEQYVNVGISGGQKKKSEMLQCSLSKPKLLLIDEIDAGLDIDALNLVKKYLDKIRKTSIILMISHDLNFFKNLKPNKVILIANKSIEKIGNKNLIEKIISEGYKSYTTYEHKSICK